MDLAEKFVQSQSNYAKMFYLWGHSYEFDDDNNWEVIEKFAEFMGGRDDIWYATNIEIYDYVKAYNNLTVSFDRKIIYNPSVIDVWFSEKNEVFCVKIGETLHL